MKPVLAQVNFPTGHLVSAMNEIRVVNSSNVEIPSFIISTKQYNGYISSATILFFTSVQALSTENFSIYYGNPSSSSPPYRLSQVPISLHGGVLSLTSQGYKQGGALNISYAGNFYLSLYDKLSVNGKDFGSSFISNNTYTILKQWREIGSIPSKNVTITETSYLAGDLTLDRILVAYNSSFLLLNIISNTSNQTANPILTDMLDYSQLPTLGLSTVSYNPSSQVLYGYVAGTYLGFTSSEPAQIADIGSPAKILNQTLTNNLTKNYFSSGASFASLRYTLQPIPAGGYSVISQAFSLAAGYNTLQNILSSAVLSLKVRTGNEAYAYNYIPTSALLWNAGYSTSNISLSPLGATVRLPIKSLGWIPESAKVSGLVNYTLPSLNFAQSPPGAWIPHVLTSGNASAYSSPHFYSTELGRYVGRVSTWVFNQTGSSTAALVSRNYSVFDSSKAELHITYVSNITLNSYNSTRPYAYMVLDVDTTSSGHYNESFIFPVSGSLLPINSTSIATLVADGSWHQVAINLSSIINSQNFEFRLRILSASSPGFLGQTDIEIDSAFVSWSAEAGKIISLSLNPSSPQVDAVYKPTPYLIPPSGLLSLNISFLAVQQVNFTSATGNSFKAILASPVSNLTLEPYALIAFSGYSVYNPSLLINDTEVPVSTGANMISASGPLFPLRQSKTQTSSTFNLTFTAPSLNIYVVDVNDKPLQGVAVNITTIGPPLSISGKTDSSGAYSAQLLPWLYLVNAYYQGYQIFSGFVEFQSTQALRINASVYSVSILAVSESGAPLANIPVTVTTRNYSVSGMTNIYGRFTFPAVSNVIYLVSLTSPDGTQLTQAIRASMNNQIVSVTVNYKSPQSQLFVEGIVALIIVAVAVVLFYFSRRPNYS